MKSKIDAAERAVARYQKQYLSADTKCRDAKKELVSSEESGVRIREATAKFNNANEFLGVVLERLEKAREELASLDAQAIEEEDNGEIDDSGDDWSEVAVNTSGGAVARVRSMSGDSRDDEGVEEEEEDLEDYSNPDGDSKEEDNLFVENDESEESSEGNAGFQGELILIIPTSIDNKLYIVDERQKYNESKVEIEMMFLEERDAKILYEDSPYNALLLEHLLTMPASMNLFDDLNYEGMVLKA
jgi:hypothetical protein